MTCTFGCSRYLHPRLVCMAIGNTCMGRGVINMVCNLDLGGGGRVDPIVMY